MRLSWEDAVVTPAYGEYLGYQKLCAKIPCFSRVSPRWLEMHENYLKCNLCYRQHAFTS